VHRPRNKVKFNAVAKSVRKRAFALLVCWVVAGCVTGAKQRFACAQDPQKDVRPSSEKLSFVRAFSSADDVRRFHSFLYRSFEVIAGSKDGPDPVKSLHSPSAITTDSNHHIFVADPGANVVHVFDFTHSKYNLWENGRDRLGTPVSLAVDGHNNLYVIYNDARTVVIYDSAGRFRGHLWIPPRAESSRYNLAGIAIDKATGLVYVCDRLNHMIIAVDDRGRTVREMGKPGGGNQAGEFRFPSQVLVERGELYVLDAGNMRIQILDPEGRFRRAIALNYADKRTSLAVDGQDSVYVSNFDPNQIEVFGHDGKRLYTFDLSTVKGANFIHPSGIWVDAGYCLYVVDSQSRQVGLFQISGKNAPRCR
jgi:DNA-binding beta-propeller fold protein YncE